jgi:hypothetical protein
MKIDFVVVFGAMECEPRILRILWIKEWFVVQGKDSTASFLIIYRVLNLVK